MALSLSPIMCTISITPTPAPTRASLPTELWVQILSHVDEDFTLWVVCRRLSKLIRAEAEREFATQRLGQLCATFEMRNAQNRWDHGMSVATEDFPGLSLDEDRANFNANFWIHEGYPDNEVEYDLEQLLSNPERSFRSRYTHFVMARKFNLGPYCNNIPVPGLQFDHIAGTLSFDLKPFLNNLFGIYALAQRMQGTWLSMMILRKQSSSRDETAHQPQIFVRNGFRRTELAGSSCSLSKSTWQAYIALTSESIGIWYSACTKITFALWSMTTKQSLHRLTPCAKSARVSCITTDQRNTRCMDSERLAFWNGERYTMILTSGEEL